MQLQNYTKALHMKLEAETENLNLTQYLIFLEKLVFK